MSLKKSFAALTATCLCVLSQATLAVVVLQPVGVSVDPLMGTFGGYPASAMISQAGLTGGATYISGVTDYDAYIASKPNHTAAVAAGNSWRSDPNGNLTGFLEFDLGGVFTLTNVALWSGSAVPTFGSLKSFDVWVDKVFAGSFPVANQFNPLYAQSFKLLSAMKGSHVRFDLTSSYDPTAVSIAEVAFGVAGGVSVAEPFTVALLAFGLVGFGVRKRPLSPEA